jgi:hypothetical protein
MNRMFRALLDRYPTELFVYIDDILVATDDNISRHRQIVNDVLDVLTEESYFLRPTKCSFEQDAITYLGIIVENNQLKPTPTRPVLSKTGQER